MTEVYTQYDEAKEAFAEAEELAIRDWTCFCKCGCRNPDVQPVNRVGFIAPGLCKRCTRLGFPRHDLATAATFWDDMESEEEAYAKANPQPLAAPVPAYHAAATQEATPPRAPGFLRSVLTAFTVGLNKGYSERMEREGK